LIERLIGEYYDLEDKHFNENFKRRFFEREVNDILYDWDKIRCSESIKKSLELIDPKIIEENLKFLDEYRNMRKDQMAVLVNAQRLLLSLKKSNPWDAEIKYAKSKNKELNHQIEQLNERIGYLEQVHKEDQLSIVSKD